MFDGRFSSLQGKIGIYIFNDRITLNKNRENGSLSKCLNLGRCEWKSIFFLAAIMVPKRVEVMIII